MVYSVFTSGGICLGGGGGIGWVSNRGSNILSDKHACTFSLVQCTKGKVLWRPVKI